MLRIAVPNKGSLAEPAAEMLREAGYRMRRDSKELVLADPENDVEFFYLRPRDIAVYVGSGTVDVGITGRDLLLDSGSAAIEVMPLGFGALDLPVAAPPGTCATVAEISRSPGRHLLRRAWSRSTWPTRASRAEVVRLDGAVETAITPGGRRRHRRRRRDRHHAAQRRARGLRRADPAQRGGADPPRGRHETAAVDVLRAPAHRASSPPATT